MATSAARQPSWVKLPSLILASFALMDKERGIYGGDHPLLWWTRVTAYAAAAICSLLVGVM